MAQSSVPPPFNVPIYGPDGAMTDPWQRYLLLQQTRVDNDLAPIDAQYWVSTASGPLTAERNLGALASGYLKVTVAIGVATPVTVAAIPATDIAAGTAGINISGTAATATALQTARAINGVSFDGTSAITVTASANTLTGTALPALNGSALTHLTGANIDGDGTYTPTLTNVANVDASTAYVCQYLRVGARVMVSGRIDVDPTAATTTTRVGISLPIPSNFSSATGEQCAGTAVAPAVVQAGSIAADATNDRADLQFISADAANHGMFFSFLYQVLP